MPLGVVEIQRDVPRFVVGDLVKIHPVMLDGTRNTGIVVSVRQSNFIPDAKARGLADVFEWSYWVFNGDAIVGPMTGGYLNSV